jgi:hypothetical protein
LCDRFVIETVKNLTAIECVTATPQPQQTTRVLSGATAMQQPRPLAKGNSSVLVLGTLLGFI